MDDDKPADHKNIHVALAASQAVMGAAVKGATNPAFKSRYADLADVVAVARPALTAHGIAFYHTMLTADAGLVMRTILAHGASDTRIECDVPLIVDKQNMQGVKSATTYAKRIGLESLTGISPDDDDGNAAAAAPPPPEAPKVVHPADKADAMIAALEAKGIAMVDHPRFAPDLAALRVNSADDAARVDAAVAALTPKLPVLDDDIPYEGK